jgi:hypothetical protein
VTTPIDTTKLRELLTHAQLGPCVARYNSDTHYWEVREIGVGLVAEGLTEADAAIIVAAVNALEPLLDALDEWKDKHDAVAATRAGVIAQRDDLAARLREAEAELDDNIPDGPLAVEEMDRDDLEAFAHELIAKLRRATAGADGK